MYSPINNIQTPTFDGVDGLYNNHQLDASNGMDYMRRFSYADLLSNQSESSLSDYEQQTPSPSNGYEDYIFQQQQHLQHPLDEQKRRMSMIEQASYYQQQSPSYMLSTDYLQPLNNMSMLPPSSLGYVPYQQRSMSYSAGDALSNLVPTMFNYQVSGQSSPMMLNNSTSNHSTTALSDMVPFGETEEMPPSDPQQVKLTKSGKVKQYRSRGRRVSNNPTLGAKMFTCKHEDCGKIFKRSEHLKRHIRSIHTLEKPFECPYQTCSKRFSRSDNLNQHIRIHRHTNKEKLPNTKNNSSSSSSSSASSPSSRHASFSNCMPSYM
ncbi:hypothetical protein BC941DRAFT_502644 [Chlamydoabsidia padenii]|nr:hypothetical protein BC941DRAFT_502644 [Chlamydoabsidia padenii]